MTAALFGLSSLARPDFLQAGIALSDITYAVLDLGTTGLDPDEDRIVEIAVTRVRGDGSVENEYSSLVNPGRSAGPTFIHRITDEMLANAPTFVEVMGDVLIRLNGAVVVAHNASFDEAFLAAEFTRAGVSVPAVPALDTAALARELLPTRNQTLGTCCRYLQIPAPDGHTALGNARATGQLMVELALLAQAEDRWVELLPGAPMRELPMLPRIGRPKRRVAAAPQHQNGWMQGLLTKLYATSLPDAASAAGVYLDLLAGVMADGSISSEEAAQLAELAHRAGLDVEQVEALNAMFLNGLRAAALEGWGLSHAALNVLVDSAAALNHPDVFAGMRPTRAHATGPETPRVPQPRRRARAVANSWSSSGRRILLLAKGQEAQAFRDAADTAGGVFIYDLRPHEAGPQQAAQDDLSLVSLVIIDTESADDARVAAALRAGAVVVPLTAAWELLGLTRSASLRKAQASPPKWEHATASDTAGAVMSNSIELTRIEDQVLAQERANDPIQGTYRVQQPSTSTLPLRTSGVAAEATSSDAAFAVFTSQPSWYADPTHRQDYRYWDGQHWTQYAASRALRPIDPVDAGIVVKAPLRGVPRSCADGS